MTAVQGASILVVGATGGLGAPVAQQLAAAGAHLTLTGRATERFPRGGAQSVRVIADLRKAGAAEHVVAEAVSTHGQLDGLVFAAGRVAFGAATELPDDVLINLFTLNTLAPIRLLRAASPHLRASAAAGRAPFVLNISAVLAEAAPMPGMAAYSASKAALTAFDAVAARELAPAGIRVIDARPPHTETGLADRPMFGAAPPLPRGLDPELVAARMVTVIEGDETDLPSSAFS